MSNFYRFLTPSSRLSVIGNYVTEASGRSSEESANIERSGIRDYQEMNLWFTGVPLTARTPDMWEDRVVKRKGKGISSKEGNKVTGLIFWVYFSMKVRLAK